MQMIVADIIKKSQYRILNVPDQTKQFESRSTKIRRAISPYPYENGSIRRAISHTRMEMVA